jgi:Zn-finger nucleic acid-binding protein
MKCPGCIRGDLIQQYLSDRLKAYACRTCEGKWIQSSDYGSWLKQIQRNPLAKSDIKASMAIVDSSGPKTCPGCRHVIVRHRIGLGMSFQLDQCGFCGSIWLDAGKWEALELQQLQTQLSMIASPSWQWQIRQQQRKDFVAAEYSDRLEPEAATLQALQAWIAKHPKRSTILAYLNSPAWTTCAGTTDSNGSRSHG